MSDLLVGTSLESQLLCVGTRNSDTSTSHAHTHTLSAVVVNCCTRHTCVYIQLCVSLGVFVVAVCVIVPLFVWL